LPSAEREVLTKNADRSIFAQLAEPPAEHKHTGTTQTAEH